MTTTLFSGGPIHTGLPGEHADWVIIEGRYVVARGTGEPPSADRSVDLDGAVLVPGFRDCHVHLPATGLYARGMDFRDERSTEAIIAAYKDRAASGDILFGGNFEEPLDRPLTRHELDAVVGAKPALLARADMHSCVVSTALLEQLDIGDLEGVDRESDGPTGYLREQAAAAAWLWFDNSLSADQQRSAVLDAVGIAYSKGIVEVHEMFVVEWRGWSSADAFLDTIKEIDLTVVVYLGTTEVERVKALGMDRIGGDWFLDGSFGSCTAWLTKPYECEVPTGSGATGIAYRSDAEVYDFFKRAHSEGMQVGVHAIGDAAIDQAIRTWQRIRAESPESWMTSHRIEHFECASDAHIAAAADLKIAASVQPAFDRLWGGPGGLYSQRMGWERAKEMNRFKTMMSSGIRIGGGSDSTVTPMDPFLQMAALRAHHVEEESLDAKRALAVMTHGAAELEPRIGPRGVIAVGGWADLVVLDRDPIEVDPEELLKTEVRQTWIKGKRVWPR